MAGIHPGPGSKGRAGVKLDFKPDTGAYVLRVPRGEADIQVLMTEYGLDLSVPRSTANEAVLLTHEPYAAVSFWNVASPSAKANLEQIHDRIQASAAPTISRSIAVPADQELWPFQRASISYALDRRNTLVGDQPGLGKTPIAISFCNEVRAKKVLVVCPANIRLQWVKKIRAWTTMEWPYVIHPILNGKHGVHPTAQWTVVSYDLARSAAIGAALAKEHWDVLILDEAHYLKSVDAGRTRSIFGGGDTPKNDPISERCDRILALTGTPLPNRPREAYTIARGLCFDAIDWASEDSFRSRYNPSRAIRADQDNPTSRIINVDERTGREAELQNRLRSWFMTRHNKREVMPQLKMPVYDLIQVEETNAVKQALAAESLLDFDPEDLSGADAEILGHIAVLRRQMGVALAPQVANYLDMLIDGGETKLVLFGWHIEVLNILEQHLGKHGIVRIDGSTGPSRKEALIQKFIKDPRVQICLGNIQSMGTGTDGLQEVSCHALICEPSWTPGENLQCFDRLDRGGQVRSVQGDIFVAPNSIAERVLASALRKMQTTHRALDRRPLDDLSF